MGMTDASIQVTAGQRESLNQQVSLDRPGKRQNILDWVDQELRGRQ